MRFGTFPFERTGERCDAGGLERSAGQADFLILIEEIGSGSETSIRVPHAGQYMEPACSSTLGTVLMVREQLGHLTLIIFTNDGS
jgi:hypothetical protein